MDRLFSVNPYVTRPHLPFNLHPKERTKKIELIKKDKQFLGFFIKYYSFKCFSEEGFCLKKHEEIKNTSKVVKLINCWDYDKEYVYDILYKCGGFHESNLYIMLEDHDLVNLLIMHLLGCNDSLNFYDLFDMINESDLKDILPSEVNVVHINNYDTDILITHILEGNEGFELFINGNNRFMSLIKKYKKEIYANNRNLIKELFRYIKWENGPDIKRILYEQEIILNWLRDSKLITEDEFDYYRFTENDFVGSYF